MFTSRAPGLQIKIRSTIKIKSLLVWRGESWNDGSPVEPSHRAGGWIREAGLRGFGRGRVSNERELEKGKPIRRWAGRIEVLDLVGYPARTGQEHLPV